MSDFFYRNFVGRIEHLGEQQMFLLVVVVVVVGFVCLRGFGSRSNY